MIKFDKAVVQTDGQDVYLSLRLPMEARQEARRFALTMDSGKLYTAELSKYREKRSLDANAMYWQFCGKLARALGIKAEEVYRRHIAGMEVYDVLCIQTDALEAFRRRWCSGHLGRRVDTRESKIPGCTTVLAYYGSSDFTRAEMSRLIEACMDDCKAVGIDTLSEREKSLLLEAWDAPRN